jgi:flagellar assembly protein FliH
MTSSSPETVVVDRASAAALPTARLDHDLRSSTLLVDGRTDARLVDPALAEVVDRAAEAAASRARAEGFAVGYQEGRERMVAEVEERGAVQLAVRLDAVRTQLQALESLAAALAASADALEARCAPVYDEVGDEIGGLVYDLVEALLGRELRVDRLHVVDAVRRCAQAAPRNAPLVLNLHPSDVAALDDSGVDLPALLHRPVEVHADHGVERGGAMAESASRRIDARLSTALERLREVLST